MRQLQLVLGDFFKCVLVISVGCSGEVATGPTHDGSEVGVRFVGLPSIAESGSRSPSQVSFQHVVVDNTFFGSNKALADIEGTGRKNIIVGGNCLDSCSSAMYWYRYPAWDRFLLAMADIQLNHRATGNWNRRPQRGWERRYRETSANQVLSSGISSFSIIEAPTKAS